MLYYSQTDGLWGDPTGAIIKLSGPCLSGNNLQGQDLNNVASQYLHNRGPLPAAIYSIGVLKYQPSVKSQGCLLTPAHGSYMGPVPRSGFFLHLRNPAHVAPDGTNASSDGCVTFQTYEDLFNIWANWVHKQGQSQVQVVATVADFPQPQPQIQTVVTPPPSPNPPAPAPSSPSA